MAPYFKTQRIVQFHQSWARVHEMNFPALLRIRPSSLQNALASDAQRRENVCVCPLYSSLSGHHRVKFRAVGDSAESS